MQKNDLFFDFRYWNCEDEVYRISSLSSVTCAEEVGYAAEYARKVIGECNAADPVFEIQLSLHFSEEIEALIGDAYAENEESYAVVSSLRDKTVKLCASSRRGLIYAVSTLCQLIEANAVCDMGLFDYPDRSVRGYKMYTPAPEGIDDFKQMIDTLLYYKYNAVMIEVGGAMEYKRHPKINEEWVSFCDDLFAHPGKAIELEIHTYPWHKDSIHLENGGGRFITQEQMRDIVSYCKERELVVVPEVPTLSHSDYIVRAYRELAERRDDPDPDTYCPSNPKTYEVVFDIIDEIIDVFEPEYMNIGHDEYYSCGKCELCKDRDPVDIFAEDIAKINDRLKSKRVQTIIWCDKLFEHLTYTEWDGVVHPFGAQADPMLDVPSLLGCKYKIPRDVILLHWCYGSTTVEEERELLDLGFKILYGNYQATALKKYDERREISPGGFFSNWGFINEEYMQRNGQWPVLLSNAYVFWSREGGNVDRDFLDRKIADSLYGRTLHRGSKHKIEIVHTTDYYKKHLMFWCGTLIHDEDWHLGDYEVTYEDGAKTYLPVRYGLNIYSDDAFGKKSTEALGASLPFERDGKMYYKTVFDNPYPDRRIVSIDYKKAMEAKVKLVRFDTFTVK